MLIMDSSEGDGVENLLGLSIEDMAGLNYKCSCGIYHKVDIHTIKMGHGVLNELPILLKEFENKRLFMIEDQNTYKVAGKRVEHLLQEDFQISKFMFREEHLVPNEMALGRLLVEIPEDTSLILGIGSGTINDMARFLSYKLHIPYVIVGTAPSMDGYASVVSPLIVDGVKTTFEAVYPLAIVADLDIMKAAPMSMIQAGLGDILGKYTALADWHLAQVLKEEYFCESVEKLVRTAVKKCELAAERLPFRENETIESLTEALILSGLAIGMVGVSRPASGEEHHLSHCWEMMLMNSGKTTEWLHGNNVGVGVGIIAEAYRYLRNIDLVKVFESGKYLNLDIEKWMGNLTKVYGESAPTIIQAKKGSISFDQPQRKSNMEKIMANWNEIKKICELYVPEPDSIRDTLKKAGAIYTPKQLGLDREVFRESFIAAKDVRKRYGVLQLLEDLGMLEEAASHVAGIYYSELASLDDSVGQ